MYDYFSIDPLRNPGERVALTHYAAHYSGAPLVSIVTPFFKPGIAFKRTVRSVLRQSLQAIEWILVDDGADEENKKYLHDAAASDARIRVITHNENKGPSAARNTGIAHAQSDYILLIDSDDMLEPTCAEKLFWKLYTRPDIDLANGLTAEMSAEGMYVNPQGFECAERFLVRNPISPQGMMIRKQVFDRCLFDEGRRLGLEDWDFWLNCFNAGCKGETIKEVTAWYHNRRNHSERWAHWDDTYIRETFLPLMQSKYPKLWENGVALPATFVFPFADIPVESDISPDVALCETKKVFLISQYDDGLLEQVKASAQQGSVAVVTVSALPQEASAALYALTEDVFRLPVFLASAFMPIFLRYYIASRAPKEVLVYGSEAFRYVPFLQAVFPHLALLPTAGEEVPAVIQPFFDMAGRGALDAEHDEDLALLLPLLAHFACEPR